MRKAQGLVRAGFRVHSFVHRTIAQPKSAKVIVVHENVFKYADIDPVRRYRSSEGEHGNQKCELVGNILSVIE